MNAELYVVALKDETVELNPTAGANKNLGRLFLRICLSQLAKQVPTVDPQDSTCPVRGQDNRGAISAIAKSKTFSQEELIAGFQVQQFVGNWMIA